MRICLLDHHTKSHYLGGKLGEAGFEFCHPMAFDYDILLVDTDHPLAVPAPEKHEVVLAALKCGIQVGLFPHGGMPVLDYDGMRAPLPLAFELVHGEGNKQVYEAFGLKRRTEVVGWSYTDMLDPAGGDINHLVFAPIHPWASGHILPFHQKMNEFAYRAFLEFPCERKTVRAYLADEPNGITERVPGVEYTESGLTLGLDVIDSADAVISYGTFACTSLARGKPVAMICPYPPHLSDEGTQVAAHFADYAELTRYPASLGDAPLEDLFKADVSEWKRLFVGEPLDVEKLVGVLESFKLNRAQRRHRARA